MKNINLLLIGLLICNLNSVLGQNFCFTPSTSSNLSLNSSYQMRSSNNNSYCLKIYFHVIRRSNGTGGQTNESVNEAFNILNQDFNPHNIFFNWDNQIDYINNDNYYSSPTTAIFSVNNHQDGIDIYLFDDSSSAGGRANGVGESSEFWVSGSYWKSPNNSLTKSHVISHEMGHVLYLWHTHHGTYNEGGNDNPCPELVNGSNSATCGDYVTDTPADPHLRFNVNQSTCEWNSSATDANGNSYNPDEKNVMSYTDINCMEYFTSKQGERMRNAIATLPYLKNVVVSCETSCPSYLSITQKVSSGSTDNQKAKVSLTASNIIEYNGTANYSAGTEVILKPGFHAKNGSGFYASIETCTTSGLKSARISADQVENKNSLKVENSENLFFSIYPNPAKTEITISCHFESSVSLKVNLYSVFGTLLKSASIINDNTTLNITEIPNGLYILKIYNSNSEIGIQKLLIQH